MQSTAPPVEILKDFVKSESSRPYRGLIAQDVTNAIQKARAHAEVAESDSLAVPGRRPWEENGRKHIPPALQRKLGAIDFMIMVAAGWAGEGWYSQQHTFELGENTDLSALVTIAGAKDDTETVIWQTTGLAVVSNELLLPVGYLHDTQYPNYLQLNQHSLVDPDYDVARDIPIRGDHIDVDANTGRVQSFQDGLHERAAVAMSIIDLVKVDARAIDSTPRHWAPLEVVS
ncbi:MAG: hypothetical protein ABI221_01550 [Candidatus Saccharimonadales bacterium]